MGTQGAQSRPTQVTPRRTPCQAKQQHSTRAQAKHSWKEAQEPGLTSTCLRKSPELGHTATPTHVPRRRSRGPARWSCPGYLPLVGSHRRGLAWRLGLGSAAGAPGVTRAVGWEATRTWSERTSPFSSGGAQQGPVLGACDLVKMSREPPLCAPPQRRSVPGSVSSASEAAGFS